MVGSPRVSKPCVSYETIRSWCRNFGPAYARTLRRRQGRLGDIWHVDEVFITIRGQRHYLWRALDQDGDVLDILVTRHGDRRAAIRFCRESGGDDSIGQLSPTAVSFTVPL